MACNEESNECKQAIKDYNQADSDRIQAESDISSAKTGMKVGGGVGGAGLVFVGVVLAASGPVGWVVAGVGITLVGAGAGGASYADLEKARKRCKDAVKRMYDAFSKAQEHCKDEKCIPPRPSNSCS